MKKILLAIIAVLLIIAGYISHNRKSLIKTQESKASSHLTFVLVEYLAILLKAKMQLLICLR